MSWYNRYPQWQYPQWQPMSRGNLKDVSPQPQGWNPQGIQPTWQPQQPQNIGYGAGQKEISAGTDIMGILGFGILPWMALRGLSGN